MEDGGDGAAVVGIDVKIIEEVGGEMGVGDEF